MAADSDVRDDNVRGGLITTSLVLGALLAGAYLAYRFLAQPGARQNRRHVEQLRDKSLKDSFPASDPPASQFFDIPVNRH